VSSTLWPSLVVPLLRPLPDASSGGFWDG